VKELVTIEFHMFACPIRKEGDQLQCLMLAAKDKRIDLI
jgi:hypothetical protein